MDGPYSDDTLSEQPTDFELAQRKSKARPWLFAAAGSSGLGAAFAGVSTADFISHLDRQVHSIHCSFIPGAGQQLGESGCRAVMMSPYSSMFRRLMWGGLPISLLALAVFAYLTYRALDFGLRADTTRRQTGFLVAGMLLPVLMSVIYGYISTVNVGAVCKLCVGIYVTSGLGFVFALLAHNMAKRPPATMVSPAPVYARWFFEGVGYVAALALVYVMFAPKSPESLDGCGRLVRTTDKHGVLVPFAGRTGGAKAIAVLDPLCPACRAFDKRLSASGLADDLSLRMALFPLDSECNWMVKDSLHPGACAVSEAILCDKDNAAAILAWSFDNQEALLEQAKKSPKSLRPKLIAKFPQLKGCLGSAKVRNQLNKSLRWAVANALPVLTPQLFIGDKRVCDEDTDLGLEFTVATMLEGGR